MSVYFSHWLCVYTVHCTRTRGNKRRFIVFLDKIQSLRVKSTERRPRRFWQETLGTGGGGGEMSRRVGDFEC